MLWLFAMVVGLLFGLIVGGKITNLARVKFRWPWLVVGAVLVRVAVLSTPLNRVEGAQYVYLLALAAIVVWTVLHLGRLPGVWLITAGAALNLLVIAVNGGRMPVASELAGPLLRNGNLGQYTVMSSATHLNLAGDWISLYPVPEAYSPGDVLIALGLAIAVFVSTATPARIVN